MPEYDGVELQEWAEMYGHPEEHLKKAQDLWGKLERATTERDRLKRLLDQRGKDAADAEDERDHYREALTRLVGAIEAHVSLGYDESDAVFDARAHAKAVLR